MAPALIIMGGCASSQEDRAFERYRAIEHSTYETEAPYPSDGTDLPRLDEDSTLSDYLAYAALNNPGLEAAFNRWKAALERILPARSLPDPRFTYGYFIEAVETRVGPQRQRFGISQMFPWYGKLKSRSEMKLAEANAVEEHYRAEKLKLFYRVKNAYYEYYYLARAIAIARENVNFLSYFEQIIQTKYKLGASNHPDLLKAQIELGKLDDRLRKLIMMKEPTVARLNATLNRPVYMKLPEPGSIPEEHIEAGDRELIAWLKSASPELKALEFDIKQAKYAVELAEQQFMPDVALGMTLIDTGTYNVSADDAGKDAVIASISINLPIWYSNYKAVERSARSGFLAARNKMRNKENALFYEVELSLFNYRDAERKINLYRETLIPKGKQSLKATEAAYRAGKLDFLNLIDAQRILLEFQLSYERALTHHAQRLAELEKLVGIEIPRSKSASKEGGNLNE